MKRIERMSWVIAAAMSWAMITHAGTYSGGSGTVADPYQIGTVADWTELRTTPADWNWGKQFILTADLDFEGATLTPVGTDASDYRFLGTFDGCRHVLRNAAVSKTGGVFVGVFGFVYGSIRNLGVENISVTGSYYVGCLVGCLEAGTISNSYAEGTVSGGTYAGGLVGGTESLSTGCTIANSHAKGSVVGSGQGAGGLVGFMDGCQISNSYAECSVTGDDGVGGLVGQAYANDVRDQIVASYATGSVSGKNDVGGLVGLFYPNSKAGLITDAYATGSVSGQTSRVGGLVGYLQAGTVTVAYATGRVAGWNAGTTYLGGLVGQRESNAVVSASYWDMETSGQASSEGGEGRTTDDMTYSYTTNTYVGWDFDVAWMADADFTQNSGYPYLGWQTAPRTVEATNITASGFDANWLAADGATNYLLDVATDAEFADFVPGYQDRSVGNVLSESVVGLTDGMTYYYRVRVQRSNGTSRNSGAAKVVVLDISAPEITVPEDMLAEATCPAGAAVSFSVNVSDLADTNPVVNVIPASGSLFPIGDTIVTVTATDASSNTATASFPVTVVDRQQSWVLAWGNNWYGQCDVPAGLTDAVAIAAGYYHGMALKSDGTMVTWGTNLYGECDVPTDLTNAVAIAAGGWNSLALRADGGVVGWGHYSMSMPVGLTDVVSLAAGFGGSEQLCLALRADGTVVAWGDYYSGQLSVPVGLSHVVQIASGGRHALALKSDGTVVAWGTNDYGQCTVPENLTNAIAVAAGGNGTGSHSLALCADGTVMAWGYNANGQCNVPAGLSNVVAIAAGNYHSMAVRADGSAVMWGGQTNVPSTVAHVVALAAGYGNNVALCRSGEDTTPPVIYGCDSRIITVTNITGSEYFWQVRVVDDVDLSPTVMYDPPLGSTLPLGDTTVTVTATDAAGNSTQSTFQVSVCFSGVVAWGYNEYGQCNVPVDLTNVVAMSAGVYHSLALKTDGTVLAWGNNDYGQCTIPAGLTNVVAVSAGGNHSLALLSDGTMAAWGWNEQGQCTIPGGLTDVVAISAGMFHTLALRSDGTVVAWGQNSYGECAVPSNLTGVVAIEASYHFSLALKADGTMAAWGYNELGQCNIPEGLTNVVGIAGGGQFSLALKADGMVAAWGYNGNGECNVPAGLTDVIGISAEDHHSLALKSDGTVVAWGNNVQGQCMVPVDLTNVVAISAGNAHSLVLVGGEGGDLTTPMIYGCEDRVARTEEPSGMAITALVRVFDDSDPNPTVAYDPPLGSVFPAGETEVTVTATDAADNVNECQFTVTVMTVPNPPTVAAATNITGDRFYANWSASESATNYLLDVATDDSFTSYVEGYQNVALGDVLTASVTGLSAGSTYFYRVRAQNSNGTSISSDIGSVSTVPGAPAAPVASAATDLTAMSFSANWSASAGATNYLLDVATDSEFTSFAVGYQDLSVGDVTTISVTGLASETIYYFRVRAENRGGTSADSETITVLTTPKSGAAWIYDWDYCRPVTITNAGNTLVEYQVLLTIDTASLIAADKMRSDGGDLRFALEDRTRLSYWIESGVNTSSTKIWVRVPSIPVGGATILAYYGNPSVISASDGAATFELFDDFDAGTLQPCWTFESHNGGRYELASGLLTTITLGNESTDPYWGTGAILRYNAQTFNLAHYGGLMVETRARVDSMNHGYFQFMTLQTNGYGVSFHHQDWWGDPSQMALSTTANDVGTENRATVDATSWHKYSMAYLPASVDLFCDDSLTPFLSSQTNIPTGTDLTFGIPWNHATWRSCNMIISYDYFRIRRYALPEPTIQLLAEMPVVDTNPPVINGCSNREVVVWDNSGSVLMTFMVEVTDADPNPTVVYDPPYGTSLPVGTVTNVTVTAWDTSGNTNTCEFTVTVVADTEPPEISGCENLSALAWDPAGVVFTYSPSITDADPNPTVIFSHESGTLFPIGDTLVTVTAWDTSGNTNTCEFTVTVAADTESPVISGCTNQTVVAWDGSGSAPVTYTVMVDDADPNPTVIFSHESGTLFPIGDTLVTVTAWDASGNTNTC